MIIAGLTGGISHGKTTFANLLGDESKAARHFESWELVAEVAQALRSENPVHPPAQDLIAINHWLFTLPDIVDQFMHVTISFDKIKLTTEKVAADPSQYVKLFEYLELIAAHPELATKEITAEDKATFRPLLQWLGGFLVINAGNGIWYDEILRRIAHLQASGCDLVTVGGVRFPSDAERLRNAGGAILQIKRPDLAEQDSSDITERDRGLIEPDATIYNDGSLAELQVCAQRVYHDLQRRMLVETYHTHEQAATAQQ